MSFYDNIILLIVDKVIIAGIAFYLWHLYSNRKKEIEKEEEKIKLLELRIEEEKKDKKNTELHEKILLLEDQLKFFYWPLSICLKNDSAVWQRVPSLYDDENQLPTDAGEIVERDFLIPNHEKAVSIIEENFHLVGENDKLIKLLVKYIRHVAVFKSLRLSQATVNPIDVNEPFPTKIIELIENETKRKNLEIQTLKQERWGQHA